MKTYAQYIREYPFKLEYLYSGEWIDAGRYNSVVRFKTRLETLAYKEKQVRFNMFRVDTLFRIVENI